jgi:hypothetical protein
MALPTNQKLEELFNVDSADTDSSDDEVTADISLEHNLPSLPETLDQLDKIEQALPAVRGLEASDTEMDDLAQKATESFSDLMNLGMQVDSRYASEIFSVASTMLGHAITAKTAKMNKKLKMIDLQMKKLKLDREAAPDDPGMPTAQGHVLDRNELLKELLKSGHSNNTNKSSS